MHFLLIIISYIFLESYFLFKVIIGEDFTGVVGVFFLTSTLLENVQFSDADFNRQSFPHKEGTRSRKL